MTERMSLSGIPEAAVYGNASEVPDSESGETGVKADVQWPNETLPVVVDENVPEGMAVMVGPEGVEGAIVNIGEESDASQE